MPNVASVEARNPKVPPTLTAGKITPEALHRWERACKDHFRVKHIAEDQQVASVLFRLEDLQLSNWIEANEAVLTALKFPAFMDRLRDQVLEKDWDRKIKLSILDFKQGDRPFDEWVYDLQTRNALLWGRPQHFSDAALRDTIENNMDPILEVKVRRIAFGPTASLQEWVAAVAIEDESVARERKALADAVDKASRARDREVYRARGMTNITNTGRPGAQKDTGGPMPQRAVLPRLTQAERAIIFDHQGCFKCRRLYVDHKGANCPNGFPSPDSYKPLTTAYAESVRDSRNKPRSRVGPVAHVGYSGSSAEPLAVLGIGEEESDDSDEYVHKTTNPFYSRHLEWRCRVDGPSVSEPVTVTALIDNGSHSVLIDEGLVKTLGLRRRRLPSPQRARLAMGTEEVVFTEWVKLKTFSMDRHWTAKLVRAIVAPNLAYPVILGGLFLQSNKILIDHELGTVAAKDDGFVLSPGSPAKRRSDVAAEVVLTDTTDILRKRLFQELCSRTESRRTEIDDRSTTETAPRHFAQTLANRLDVLAVWDELTQSEQELRDEFADRFPVDIPHVTRLPDDVYHRFRLKDPEKVIKCRSYACPKKYKDAWRQLLDQHLAAGRIRESSSEYCSPSFLIPKADPTVLPRWVNDYRALNDNTVPDHYPLPRVEAILSDCAKGSVWAKIDMTNSFFQTRVHPEDVKFTAVMTPFGLYEWVVMPMGCRNAPATHQRRMNQALRKYIGRICHVYLDDIVIWSNSIEEHRSNVRTILQALREAHLYCSTKKSQLFTTELDFLGHRISQRGIEPDLRKVERIRDWPVPQTARDVRKFLGLVQYLAAFLPRLAQYRSLLTPLTTKESQATWPGWGAAHQHAFQAIKDLVLSRECLTTIDHDQMDGRRIFVTCDASDLRTGACLSFGKSWETARPVAWDSVQLSPAERNYPTHEKEMLAIVRALKKFRADLLGTHFVVYTDHRTLECFQKQRDLSKRQARWQEFLADYDFLIEYIKGGRNTVADALSRMPEEGGEGPVDEPETVAAVLRVSTDPKISADIRCGYQTDAFCQKILRNMTSFPNIKVEDGLIYIGSRLVIPRTGTIREDLFRMAHDSLGHFGTEKSYASLRSAYYWPRMRTELEGAYIPGCDACQRNKGSTKRPTGPLHPLPIPDERGDSIAIDFIGPLPEDDGFNCIATMTDRSGSDVRIVPTRTDISAEDFAQVFFDNWYCENGLPRDIISDRDKLFISRFWKRLTRIAGVKLGMSTAFHPETDGASERTNKTVNQCLRYHVTRNQKGWVRALPRVRFAIMNTVNKSTGFSPFQLHMGRSPRLIPPITPSARTTGDADPAKLIDQINSDVAEAKDNLMLAKLFQADQANRRRGPEDAYKVDDMVMLSTTNRRKEYASTGSGRSAKLFPRHDGPYRVVEAHPSTSTYRLDIPNAPHNSCFTFHASQLKRYVPNDQEKFPGRELPRDGPVTLPDGREEHVIERILDERRRGRGWQYLVRWKGYGPGDDEWMPRREVEETIALDEWLRRKEGGRGGV